MDSTYEKIATAMFDYLKSRKLDSYRKLNMKAEKGQILFTGSSLMQYFPVEEMYRKEMAKSGSPAVYNRGIGGYTTEEFIRDIGPMATDLAPAKLFTNIGTNDMNAPVGGEVAEDPVEKLRRNYTEILDIFTKEIPACEIFLMSYFPVNKDVISTVRDPILSAKFSGRSNYMVKRANRMVQELARTCGCRYIDVNEGLTDSRGQLKAEYTIDGVHLQYEAYKLVFEALRPYIA